MDSLNAAPRLLRIEMHQFQQANLRNSVSLAAADPCLLGVLSSLDVDAVSGAGSGA
jgi:hypothetical protein